mmetsp:Transcript_69747/g.191386  ORF Transcript_69747/g.191386 Transcript_69747/m.191386 type:complete len:99 (-) Transcript_69747:237-533(-)
MSNCHPSGIPSCRHTSRPDAHQSARRSPSANTSAQSDAQNQPWLSLSPSLPQLSTQHTPRVSSLLTTSLRVQPEFTPPQRVVKSPGVRRASWRESVAM